MHYYFSARLFTLTALAVVLFAAPASAQCVYTAAFGNTTFGACTGEFITATTCAFAGEFSTFNNLAVGFEYELRSTGGSGNYITITDTSNNALAWGPSPLVWTSTLTGAVRVHVSTSALCGTEYSCHTVQGRCLIQAECTNDLDCYDGVFCNGAETCVDGECQGGSTVDCGDDYCDEDTESCVGCLNDGQCNDGMFCNGLEQCEAGECVPGEPPFCPMENPVCDERITGCVVCLNNSHCAGDTPVCDEENNSCVGCVDASDCLNDDLYCTGDPVCTDTMCSFTDDPCADAAPVCDEDNDLCVECLNAGDCPNDDLYCTGEPMCTDGICGFADDPCEDAAPVCDEENNSCVECLGNGQCPTGYECIGSVCRAGGTLQIDKATVKAGKADNSDSIKFSGLLDATEADLDAATEIIVTIRAENIPEPGVLTFTLPISEDSFSKGTYKSPKDTTDPVLKLQIDTSKGTMKFSAKNADLAGLSCPISVRIRIGDYFADIVLDEDSVNGKKPCPPELMTDL
jgi:hypothetical protein